MYELTQHDDKYDLRYRLKDKIYLASATTTSTSPASASLPSTASGLSSLAATPSSRDGKSERNYKHPGPSQQSQRGGGGRQAGSIDGPGGSRDTDGGAEQSGRGKAAATALLLVTWSNVVLCEGRVLQLYDFSGTKVVNNKVARSPHMYI